MSSFERILFYFDYQVELLEQTQGAPSATTTRRNLARKLRLMEGENQIRRTGTDYFTTTTKRLSVYIELRFSKSFLKLISILR